MKKLFSKINYIERSILRFLDIKFLNHSSLLVSSEKVSILCDPWFNGTAFNGWRLLLEDSHDINKIKFDYIWISHEHPDHFSIPTLKGLKGNKTFLYQETLDKKVLKWLIGNGHECIELKAHKSYQIEDLKITTYPCKGYDTAIVFEDKDGHSFLNSNDCKLDSKDNIALIKKNHKNIDIIAAQYSYANWAGNPEDEITPINQQDLINKRLIKLYKNLKCERFFLFASQIYFSHEENFFLNKNKPSLKSIFLKLRESGISPCVLKPNNYLTYSSFDDLRKINASIRYWDDLNSQKYPLDKITNSELSKKNIVETYNNFFKNLWEKNSLEINKNKLNEDFSILIKILDQEIYLQIWLFKKKIEFKNLHKENSKLVCELSYEMIIFLLKHNYGRGTLTINGRIKFNYEYMHRFFIFFHIPYANNIGKYWDVNKLTRIELKKVDQSSIMTSILSNNQKSKYNFNKDLNLFV